MLQILKTKQKEIAMKTRKSYAELEPVKKNSVWRGFVIIATMLKTKRKTAKTYIPVNHMFSKKSKGRSTLQLFCLLFGQITTLIGKNFSSLAFHRACVACYSSRKHE